ncbi:MAG: hypothetical protein AMJ61_00660 [Desulfobacterales bacterium SG8_35_2]|nr:MAG: hypothetical protein AMJ61_00660 [Desulfobacterales bacterium SG8_35_2]
MNINVADEIRSEWEIGILIENLMSRLRVVENLRQAGFNIKTLNSGEEATTFFKNCKNPIMIFDLENKIVSLANLKELTSENPADMERVMGFYPHVRIDLKEQAILAGIRSCYPRSKFFKNPAEVVDQIISNLLS